jgi:hypothetical protein
VSGRAIAATASVATVTTTTAGSSRRARRTQNAPSLMSPVRWCSFTSSAHTSQPDRTKNTSTPT